MKTERSIRVLLISPQPFFQWRGSPLRVDANLRVLSTRGCEVDLLTLPIGEEKTISGVRVMRVPNLLRMKEIRIGPSPAKAVFDLLILLWACCLALKHRYDVVHGIEEGGFIGVWAAKCGGSRLIFERHSDPASYRDGWLRNLVLSIYSAMERFAIRRADAVIGTGLGLVQQILAVKGGGSVHHIFDIPSSNVTATAEKTSRVRSAIAQSGDIVIMFVGSFSAYQGLPLLLEAATKVITALPACKFVIIGGSPDEIESLRREASLSRAVAQRIVFLGRVPPEEIPDHLSAADVLVSPRLGGVNTPLKLLDYLKAGRAIVATDVAANRGILDESVAVMVPPTPDGLAEGILRVVRDGEMRRHLGEMGKKLIRDRYGFECFAERLWACYEEVLSGSDTKAKRESH